MMRPPPRSTRTDTPFPYTTCSGPSYAHLPEYQRWALAFYVGQLAFPADGAARGEALWRDNAEVRAAIPDLTALVQVRPAGLGGLDQAAADDITAYLRDRTSTRLNSSH